MKHGKHKLLFVTYFFPPSGGISCQRAVRFARYLRKFGWDITVLTYGGKYPWRVVDTTLSARVSDIPTIRVEAPELERYFGGYSGLVGKLPAILSGLRKIDVMSAWVRRVIKQIPQLIETLKPDIVLITVPPFSALELVPEIKAHAPNLPVVVDMRDLLWILAPSGGPLRRFANRIQLASAQKNVFRWLAHADGIVSPTTAITSELSRTFNMPMRTVATPYDPEDFAGVSPYQPGGKFFRILHSGRIYRSNRIEPLLSIFSLLPDDILARTKLILQGYDNPRVARMCADIELVELQPTVPHKQALVSQRHADVNLVFVTETPARGGHLIVPGKIFDYIGAGRPIIAFAPAGSALNMLVENYNLGFSAPINSPELCAGVITRAFRLWEQGKLQPIPADTQERFAAPAVVARLDSFLKKFV